VQGPDTSWATPYIVPIHVIIGHTFRLRQGMCMNQVFTNCGWLWLLLAGCLIYSPSLNITQQTQANCITLTSQVAQWNSHCSPVLADSLYTDTLPDIKLRFHWIYALSTTGKFSVKVENAIRTATHRQLSQPPRGRPATSDRIWTQ
jgi:hypothetical protein